MKIFIQTGAVLFLLLSFNQLKANHFPQEKAGDSLTLGQAFINLALTENYFDTLNHQRIAKILSFEENELASIKDSGFIKKNAILYNFTYSLLYYGKARLLFSNKKDSSRKALLQWKSTLDIAINYFNKSEIQSVEPYITFDPFYEFIGFTSTRCHMLLSDIEGLKDQFTPYFNNDIYPDFKRIFLDEKKSNQFHFDSLLHYASLYNLPLRANILNLLPGRSYQTNIKRSKDWKIDLSYDLDLALDLISRYLQLNYVAENFESLCTIEYVLYEFQDFNQNLNPQDKVNFKAASPYYSIYNRIKKDDFFRENLDFGTCNRLYENLKKITKPDNCPDEETTTTAFPKPVIDDHQRKYFFPIPAPFPSAFRYINNYKPGLKKMKEVDDHLKVIFNSAGYKDHMQYYYVKSGFAMTTSLEAINKEGGTMNQDKRWNVTVAGNSKFSLYEVFKSIFFATESEFRIFALVISPKEAAIQSSPTTIGAMQDLLINSYSSLPKDLENFELPEKVLTILVYHFHQSDIGEVPLLDISKRLSVEDHLKKTGLEALLNNQ